MIRSHLLREGGTLRWRSLPRTVRIGLVGLALAGTLAVLAGLGVAWFQASYTDRVYPGVSMAGQALRGMGEAEVRSVIARLTTLPAGEMALQTVDGVHHWSYTLRDLGVSLDADAIVAAALAYGRTGETGADLRAQWAGLTGGGIPLALSTRVDAAVVPAVVAKLALEVERPAVNPTLENHDGVVVVVPGTSGVTLDRAASTRLISAALAEPPADGTLRLPVQVVPPAIDAAELGATRDAAFALTGAPINVRVQGSPQSLTLAPTDLQEALVLGTGNQGASYTVHLEPGKLTALLEPLADRVRQAPQDAALRQIKGKLVITDDIAGRELDLDSATQAVLAAAETPGRLVTLTLRLVPAAISAAQVQAIQQQWTRLLKEGFRFHYAGDTWTLKGSQLGKSLVVARNQGGGGAAYRLQVDTAVIAGRLAAIAGAINARPRAPRFRLVDDRVQVVAKSRDGQKLDEPASLNAALAAIDAGKNEADLVVSRLPAVMSSDNVPQQIATPDLLASSSTSYKGSSPERAHNVEFGTSLLDSALVPPGAEFDTTATMGPLTLEAGFQMGYGIIRTATGVTTIPSEAGGICQVSTTLFHSVFRAGLPITERNYHSYWIALYGRPPSGLQGLDATISPPEKDFRWLNTTGNWVLVRAHAGGGTVNFELWGTNPGWTVKISDPVITKMVPTSKKPIYEANWQLRWGVTRMVEHAQPGFDADIHREVYDKTGALIDDWHAVSHYLPAHDRYLVGQKGKPKPQPKPVATPTPGPVAQVPAAPAATPAAPVLPVPIPVAPVPVAPPPAAPQP